jgi:DNA-binding response OmpR family regulator
MCVLTILDKRMRIVIFENDAAILELCLEVLRMEDYEVFPASYGANAFEQIKALQPDLVMLDCTPGHTEPVLNLVEKLKLNPSNSSPAILLCSTDIKRLYGNHEFWSLHQVATLAKPFDIQTLLITIQEALIFWGKLPPDAKRLNAEGGDGHSGVTPYQDC